VRGIDKADVREGLREVSDQSPSGRVVFLGEEPEVVAQVEDPLEEPPRLRSAAEKGEIVGEPERADEEGRLSDGEAVDVGRRLVAADEAVVQELALDGFDGAGHAGI
jgi:hypothetical protein